MKHYTLALGMLNVALGSSVSPMSRMFVGTDFASSQTSLIASLKVENILFLSTCVCMDHCRYVNK